MAPLREHKAWAKQVLIYTIVALRNVRNCTCAARLVGRRRLPPVVPQPSYSDPAVARDMTLGLMQRRPADAGQWPCSAEVAWWGWRCSGRAARSHRCCRDSAPRSSSSCPRPRRGVRRRPSRPRRPGARTAADRCRTGNSRSAPAGGHSRLLSNEGVSAVGWTRNLHRAQAGPAHIVAHVLLQPRRPSGPARQPAQARFFRGKFTTCRASPSNLCYPAVTQSDIRAAPRGTGIAPARTASLSRRRDPSLALPMPATARDHRHVQCTPHTSPPERHQEPVRAAQCQLQGPRTTVRRRSDDLGMCLEGTQSGPDLELCVELSGLEPLTSCMPSGGSTSTRVHTRRSPSSRVPARPPASR